MSFSMRFNQRPNLLVLAIAVLFLSVPNPGQCQKKSTMKLPDFTQGDPIPKGAKHDWNLGPTGARGWIYANQLETTQARQIRITKIEKGSPSSKILQLDDVILGVGETQFTYDPRTELGKAISAAESSNGELSLIRWRSGDTANVTVKLAKMGSYSATAPFDCPKSQRIFEQGCAALAQRMEASPNRGNPIVRSLNALALLSSGRKEYLPLVRQQVEWAAKYSDPNSKTLHSWFYGPVNILLAEYAMATGDKTFVGDMERITMEIVRGQSNVGSWGHRFALPGGRLKGYGMMNAPGLPLTASLILARKAGVANRELDQAIDKSARLIRFYVDKGSVPYGDHSPWTKTHDDNGKNGIAALVFNWLEERKPAEYFSRMSVASHGAEREMGHTGNFFNMLWAMPAVALSGPHATGAWIEEFGWYYDLARRWDGTYQHQGPPQMKPDKYRSWDSTGAYLLAYAQPLRKLHITGKPNGSVTQASRKVADELIADGRGFSLRLKEAAYKNRNIDELMQGLANWSPVVRERSAMALAKRPDGHLPQLLKLLDGNRLNAQLGACQALAHLKQRAGPATSQLIKKLDANSFWLRVKAAEALAGIGKDARPAVPKLLSMLAEQNVDKDPRGMQQRYLCFALFDRRTGLLKKSVEGIDRERLYRAIRNGLQNEDGRARGALANVFTNLSYEEIEPLLPQIHRAVITPAPSGNMFADTVRLSGLDILAKHRIQEGVPLCLDLIETNRWGYGKRITKCLKTLQSYGSAAKEIEPSLEQLQQELANRKSSKQTIAQIKLIRETIKIISSGDKPPALRPLPTE